MVPEAIAEHHDYFRRSPPEFQHAKSFHNPIKYLTTCGFSGQFLYSRLLKGEFQRAVFSRIPKKGIHPGDASLSSGRKGNPATVPDFPFPPAVVDPGRHFFRPWIPVFSRESIIKGNGKTSAPYLILRNVNSQLIEPQ